MTAITGLLAEVDQQLNREGDTQTQYSTELKVVKKKHFVFLFFFIFIFLHAIFTTAII